ncbi:hypothetical protein [Agromyces sp. H66]|uniref:hypothetical protein n=1 Tax=Agromyces sp. H66 TaxID=2529859 RepID=UPI0010AA772C|nr:hypothetical protein [Agromyces sp. H66]
MLAAGAAVFAAAPAYAEDSVLVPIPLPDGFSDQKCEELDSGKSEEGGLGETEDISAPAGQVITMVCVKAGDENSDAGVEYYMVEPPTNTVTITHSTGKDISHYSFSYEPEPTTPPTTPPATTPPVTTPPVETTPPAGGGGDGGVTLAETGFENGWLAFVGIGALAVGAAIAVPRMVAKRR